MDDLLALLAFEGPWAWQEGDYLILLGNPWEDTYIQGPALGALHVGYQPIPPSLWGPCG